MLELLDWPRTYPKTGPHTVWICIDGAVRLDHAQTLAVILPGVMTYMRKEKAAKLIRMGEVVFGITEGSAMKRRKSQ